MATLQVTLTTPSGKTLTAQADAPGKDFDTLMKRVSDRIAAEVSEAVGEERAPSATLRGGAFQIAFKATDGDI